MLHLRSSFHFLAMLGTLFVASLLAANLHAQDYDLVILNGQVMDPETKLDALRNVGIRDGKIAAITEDAITGKQTVNAKDHVVSPGFVDGHCHIVDSPLGQKALLRDGVTTTLDLEAAVRMPAIEARVIASAATQTNHLLTDVLDFGAMISIQMSQDSSRVTLFPLNGFIIIHRRQLCEANSM